MHKLKCKAGKNNAGHSIAGSGVATVHVSAAARASSGARLARTTLLVVPTARRLPPITLISHALATVVPRPLAAARAPATRFTSMVLCAASATICCANGKTVATNQVHTLCSGDCDASAAGCGEIDSNTFHVGSALRRVSKNLDKLRCKAGKNNARQAVASSGVASRCDGSLDKPECEAGENHVGHAAASSRCAY